MADRFLRSGLGLCGAALTLVAGRALAGDIAAVGNVVPLDHIDQMVVLDGVAEFDEQGSGTLVSLTQYKPLGMRFGTGAFATILPGVMQAGDAYQAQRQGFQFYFPSPQGGGFQNGVPVMFAGVVTFSQKVTQVGLTASTNGNQYLTVWDADGKMLGQVTWMPQGTSSFIGIDSKGVPIAMAAYGNDDVWGGQKYDIGGSTIISDSWVWGRGECTPGTYSVQGNVTALSDKKQVAKIQGIGAFDEGPTSGAIPLGQYSANGLTFKTGTLASILPGVSSGGSALAPSYTTLGAFPAPLCGHGSSAKQHALQAGVATFNGTVKEVGLSASGDGVRYLTAWAADGTMLGQVKYEPNGSSAAFVGLYSATPIKMVAYGDDDLWNGAAYDPSASVFSDTWLWAGSCAADADCANSNKCDGTELCSAGVCTSGTVGCDDKNTCTDDTCNTKNGCTYVNNVVPCSDGDFCTVGDKCSGGTCAGQAKDCDDKNTCTDDSCDSKSGCVYQNNTKSCDDASACTVTDTCAGGKCSGSAKDCDDKNGCTDDSCDPLSGCKHASSTMTCSDNDACTQMDTCVMGSCVGKKLSCDDKDACTADACHMDKGCDHTLIKGCCKSDGDCNGGSCVANQCKGGSGAGGDGAASSNAISGCGCMTPGGGEAHFTWLVAAFACGAALRRRGKISS